MSDAFFLPDGDEFVSTELTRGPWDDRFQHAGPPTALLAAVAEDRHAREDLQVARATFEILKPVPIGHLTVKTQVRRGGRNVELVEAALTEGDVELILARIWRIRHADALPVGDARPALVPPPGPEEGAVRPFFPSGSTVGYHTAMEVRFLEGAFLDPGPARVWMRMRYPLLPGREPSPIVRVLAAADSGNGVSAVLDYHHWLFINPDLTVYLHRLPEGEWIHLDAHTTVDPHGVGMAQTVISDLLGEVGRGLQSLLVDRR